MREFQRVKLKEENGVSVNGVRGETDWEFVFHILNEGQIWFSFRMLSVEEIGLKQEKITKM